MINSAFHLHTVQVPPPEGVETISIKKFLNQLYRNDITLPIITNKNTMTDAKNIRNYVDRLGIFVPYAAEARTKPNNRRDLGIDEYIEVIAVFDDLDGETEKVAKNANRYGYKDFIHFVKRKNGKIVLPHPYLKRCGIAYLEGDEAVEELCRKELVDGIEWNLQMDNPIIRSMKVNNEKGEVLLNRINRKYGLKIPLIFGNDAYFGDIGIVMKVEADDPKEAVEKLFEGRFTPQPIKIPMPQPYYLLKHLYTALKHELRGTLSVLF